MDNQKKLIRFFPFALTRIERLRDDLNRMYESGYQIVKIKFGCILIFQKAAVKEDFKYYLKEEIHPTTLKMKLIQLDNRIKECITQKKMLKTVHGHYEEEDWKGFIIQGKVHI